MGAAGSVRAVYADALKWFQQYIDKETYLADFSNLDEDSNGGLTFMEFRNWVSSNAEKDGPDSCWAVFLTSGTVLAMAHKAAAAHGDFTASVDARHIVDVTSFRALLIHLYATSILWRHFAGVKNWHQEENQQEDLSHYKLNYEDFSMGVRSFCNAHCQEEIAEETMKEDFNNLATTNDEHVGFVQLCTHCVQYMDMQKFEETASQIKARQMMGVGKNVDITDPTSDLKPKPKGVYADLSVEDRNEVAMSQVKRKLDAEDKKAAEYIHAHAHEHSPPRTLPVEGATAVENVEAPVTEPPVTEPPVTDPPVTEPPVTEPPVTEPPAPVE